MDNKCHNKKLFYFENPSAIETLSNESLMKAYQFAKQKALDEDFVLLLESELLKRRIIE